MPSLNCTAIDSSVFLSNAKRISAAGLPTTGKDLRSVDVDAEYKVIRLLGEGTYGKVHLAQHKKTGTVVALKHMQKEDTKVKDFQREFELSYYLSPHRSIVITFDVAFETKHSFCFVQEYAACGDLFEAIPPQQGLPEDTVKDVMKQIVSAIEFMHSKDIVHRDVKPENVLVFDEALKVVKLTDFGLARKGGTLVKKKNSSIPYTPPEICDAVYNEGYVCETSTDVWSFGVTLYCCMTGNFPWEKADIDDSYYNEFLNWQKRKTVKIPSQWRKFSPRLMRLFRRLLEVKPERRCKIEEIHKYAENKWIRRRNASRYATSEINGDRSDSGEPNLTKLNMMFKASNGGEAMEEKEFRDQRLREWILSLPEGNAGQSNRLSVPT